MNKIQRPNFSLDEILYSSTNLIWSYGINKAIEYNLSHIFYYTIYHFYTDCKMLSKIAYDIISKRCC